VTAPVVEELASFMRKANRALRLGAMQTLDAFVVYQAPLVPAAGLEAIISEAASLVSCAPTLRRDHALTPNARGNHPTPIASRKREREWAWEGSRSRQFD
jgi:hypothetical protein